MQGRNGNISSHPGTESPGLQSGTRNILVRGCFHFEKNVERGPFIGCSPQHEGQEESAGLQHPVKKQGQNIHDCIGSSPLDSAGPPRVNTSVLHCFWNGRVEGHFPAFYHLMSFRYRTFEVSYSYKSCGTFQQGHWKESRQIIYNSPSYRTREARKESKWLQADQKTNKQTIKQL